MLKNRYNQPIPERCSLTDAINWLFNGALPTSLEDRKNAEPSPYYIGLVNNQPSQIVYDIKGNQTDITEEKLLSIRNLLQISVKNGQIGVWGIPSEQNALIPNIPTDVNPIELNTSTKLITTWKEYIEKIRRNENIESPFVKIPSNLWHWRLPIWYINVINAPPELEFRFQFSEVVISTNDLFRAFKSRGFEPQSPINHKTSINDFENELPKQNKRGPKPKVPREIWLEELLILYMQEKFSKKDKMETIYWELQQALIVNHNVDYSLDHIRQDMVMPLINKSKDDT